MLEKFQRSSFRTQSLRLRIGRQDTLNNFPTLDSAQPTQGYNRHILSKLLQGRMKRFLQCTLNKTLVHSNFGKFRVNTMNNRCSQMMSTGRGGKTDNFPTLDILQLYQLGKQFQLKR